MLVYPGSTADGCVINHYISTSYQLQPDKAGRRKEWGKAEGMCPCHRLIFTGPSMNQSKLKSGRLRAGDVTYGKNKTSIMGIWCLSSILSVLFKEKNNF